MGNTQLLVAMRVCATTAVTATVATTGKQSVGGGSKQLFEAPGTRACATTTVAATVVTHGKHPVWVGYHGCLRLQGCVFVRRQRRREQLNQRGTFRGVDGDNGDGNGLTNGEHVQPCGCGVCGVCQCLPTSGSDCGLRFSIRSRFAGARARATTFGSFFVFI